MTFEWALLKTSEGLMSHQWTGNWLEWAVRLLRNSDRSSHCIRRLIAFSKDVPAAQQEKQYRNLCSEIANVEFLVS